MIPISVACFTGPIFIVIFIYNLIKIFIVLINLKIQYREGYLTQLEED